MPIEDLFCAVAALIPSRRTTHSVVAICYHRLSDHFDGTPLDRFTIKPGLLEDHLSIIRDSGLDVIDPDLFAQVEKPSILITFDDNVVSHVRTALPILADFGVRATFFINPDELDQPGLLTSNDIDTLISAGMWVGAHSDSLNLVSSFSPRDFESRVIRYREFLEKLDMPLTWAYPGGFIGSFHTAHDEILKRHGFDLRFSTLERPCDCRNTNHVHGRYVIRKNCSDRYFRSVLAGGLQLLRYYKIARAKVFRTSTVGRGQIGAAKSTI